MKKISIIIPVYNAEAFITQCISSVIHQSYGDWEAVVIDDGSTDRSWEICREFSRRDDRIRLYRQEHGGISRARNYGLEAAEGGYLFFLDSDDAVHPLLLEALLEQMQKRDADLVFCDYAEVENQEMDRLLKEASVKDEKPLCETAEGLEAEEWFHIKYKRELARINGLFRRECIGTMRFDESMPMGEDTLFLYQLFSKQIRTVFFPCSWYYYRIHPSSITHSKAATLNGYYECNRIIRDHECERGHYRYALEWETRTMVQLNKNYTICRRQKDQAGCDRIKEKALSERKHPIFRHLKFNIRLRYYCCFHCYPVYIPLDKVIFSIWSLQRKWQKR